MHCAVLWLLTAVAACLGGAAVAQPLVVKIGHVAPTSGWMSIVGIECENAARMAIEQLNARALRVGDGPVAFELVTADDVGTESRARAAAQAMVAAQVRGVVGHLTSGTTLAAAKIYAEAGIPQLAPAATHPLFTRSGSRTAFRLVADDAEIARRLGRHAVEQLKARRFAVIDDRSVYGQGSVEQFSSAVLARGGRIVVARQTTGDADDFGELLSAVQAEQADAVFFGGTEPQAARLLRQMKRLGITVKLIGGDFICTPDLVSYFARGEAFDDQVVCAMPGGTPPVGDPATAGFIADYTRRFGIAPSFYGPHAYDAVMLIAHAMVRAGSTEPAVYLPALAATRDHRGASGVISFDGKGDLVEPALGIFTYTGEKRRLIGIVR